MKQKLKIHEFEIEVNVRTNLKVKHLSQTKQKKTILKASTGRASYCRQYQP